MATRSITLSDISGSEIADGQHVVVLIEHPNYPSPLEIDATVAEADKLQTTKLDLVHVTINHGGRSRKVVIDAKAFEKLIPETVLEGARKAHKPAEGKPARTTKPAGEKVDYTAPDKYGQLHRGRLTDEEISLVQANREQASKNREAQTGSAINWSDAKEIARYKLS